MVGTLSGAYSSIFIASPVLTHWKEAEPVYRARRKRIAAASGGHVPAYATTAAGEMVDVAPKEKQRSSRRLTQPDDPAQGVSPTEFSDLVRDLHADQTPTRTATAEREEPAPRDPTADLDSEDLVLKDDKPKKPRRPRNRKHGRAR